MARNPVASDFGRRASRCGGGAVKSGLAATAVSLVAGSLDVALGTRRVSDVVADAARDGAAATVASVAAGLAEAAAVAGVGGTMLPALAGAAAYFAASAAVAKLVK